MTLAHWQSRLDYHFAKLSHDRATIYPDAPIFALEHGLSAADFKILQNEIRADIRNTSPSTYTLPWIVYAAELGYQYSGEEYWQTFEESTPGWKNFGDRNWLRDAFLRFREKYRGAEPSGKWANRFTIICWPIAHAILPKDLQYQLAEILYGLRRFFTAEYFQRPEKLGEEILTYSYDCSSRFQSFAESTLLTGQIARALLFHGKESTQNLIYSPTLKRIVEDLTRTQLTRDWLQDAQKYAEQRVNVTGLARTATSLSLRHELSAEQARREVSLLTIEPRLILRPTPSHSWDVLLEIPDLSHLLPLHPEVAHVLINGRCTVKGSSGRPLARGRLLHGRQQIVLAQWPSSNEVLLQFEPSSPFLEYLLRTEVLLRPGPSWLFRIASDNLAYEVRGLTVRPGQSYLLLKPDPIPSGVFTSPSSVTCQNINALRLHLPSTLTKEHVQYLKELGIKQARTIAVWPVGVPVATWDGDGNGGWLVGEVPRLAIATDHPIKRISLRLESHPGESLQIDAVEHTNPTYIELPTLPPGTHRLVLQSDSETVDQAAHLDIVVREPRSWKQGFTGGNAILAMVHPPRPTLEQLWEGRVALEIEGPPNNKIECRIRLFNRYDLNPSLERVLPSLRTPITTKSWKVHFRQHFQEQPVSEQAWEKAHSCRIDFNARELGQFSLHCEREFTPLRWTAAFNKFNTTLNLLDERGLPLPPKILYYTFKTPTQSVPVPWATHGEYLADPLGGLYVAKTDEYTQAIIVPPLKKDPRNICDPIVGSHPSSITSFANLLTLAESWFGARIVGGLFVLHQRRLILRAITQKLITVVAGAKWQEVEAYLHKDIPRGLRELQLMVSPKIFQASLGVALSRDSEAIAKLPVRGRVTRLGDLFQKFSPVHWKTATTTPDSNQNTSRYEWLAEFALRLASAPWEAREMAGQQLESGINCILNNPFILRAARYLVLTTDIQQERGIMSEDALFRGWDWK